MAANPPKLLPWLGLLSLSRDSGAMKLITFGLLITKLKLEPTSLHPLLEALGWDVHNVSGQP